MTAAKPTTFVSFQVTEARAPGANRVENEVGPVIQPFVLSVIPGGQYVLAMQGAHQLGTGYAQFEKGETLQGTFNMVAGSTQVFGSGAVVMLQRFSAAGGAVGNIETRATTSFVLDSSTPSGSLVSHGKYSTAIGSDSATMTNFNIAIDTGSGHNVIVHGSRPDYDALGGGFFVDGNATNSQHIINGVL